MRPRWRSCMLLVASAMAFAGVDTVYADEQHQCFFESIQATFTVETSTYRVEAGCMYYHPLEGPVPAQRLRSHWSSVGTYDSRTGVARKTSRSRSMEMVEPLPRRCLVRAIRG